MHGSMLEVGWKWTLVSGQDSQGNGWQWQCRWYDLVVAAEDDICTIMTVESGKPFKESKAEFVGG